MKNILRVLLRDISRLLRAPAALAVVLVLIVLPSLYAWFNIVGFWNPYEHTGNLRVCVANEDEGAVADPVGSLNAGSQIVEQLQGDSQMGWAFVDRATALEEVAEGKAYAAFVIPSDFSESIASLLAGGTGDPRIEYYVNEKSGPVSTKITDTGATLLDETVNGQFVSMVSEVVTDTIERTLSDASENVNLAESEAASDLGRVIEGLRDARASIADLGSASSAAAEQSREAAASLGAAKEGVSLLSQQLSDISELVVLLQGDLSSFDGAFGSMVDATSHAIGAISGKTNAAIAEAAAAVEAVRPHIEAAASTADDVVGSNQAIINGLQSVLDADTALSEDDRVLAQAAIDALTARNETLRQAAAGLDSAGERAASSAESVAGASAAVDSAVETALADVDAYRSSVSQDTLPVVYAGLSQISSALVSLSSSVGAQTALVDQASALLDELARTLDAASGALGQTDSVLADIEADAQAVRTDLLALSASSAFDLTIDGEKVDPATVARFVGSPTQIQTEKLYPLNAYGSAMAPLFTNLTLWIGAFMLLVILRQEVDDEGVRGLTLGQRYWARWLFMAMIAVLQAVVCVSGDLIIGVQSQSAPMFYLTAIAASLTYLSIQFALSATLQHVGKGICIVLVFIQIPGATGLYPIEMTQPFFQAVYPFFPFTYGINAMRETISGFYGSTWATCMGVLALFAAVAFAVGLLVRPHLVNLNRLFARQIAEGGILNGEEMQVPARRYRIGTIVRALAEREEFALGIAMHERRFKRWYPRLRTGIWVAGVAVPVLAGVALSLTEGEKVILLTIWLAWFVLMMLLLVVLEFVRDTIEHRATLESMSDEELRDLIAHRGGLSSAANAVEAIGACSSEASRERKEDGL